MFQMQGDATLKAHDAMTSLFRVMMRSFLSADEGFELERSHKLVF